MTLLIIGVAVAFNLLIVLWKFQNRPLIDAIVDASLLILVAMVFSVSTAALTVGTIGSFIVSVYLIFKPFRFHATA